MQGLEVWLNGTRDELRAGWAALHRLGSITQLGDLHPLEARGRYATYLRLTVAASEHNRKEHDERTP